jgi:hypothetical protein
VNSALVILAFLKLLTFAWYPFSDGFDSCYRSLYVPQQSPEACEKSYEGPFLRRSDLGLDNTSRIDHTIDFGVHMHDWSLPFMNEFPRLGALWLDRFPFTAKYGAVIRTDSEEQLFLPIYGNGEVSGNIGGEIFSTESVPFADRYEFPRLILPRVPNGVSELVLDYRFSEDDASETPDSAPPIRGPYASLKVGEPQTRDSILKFADVRIRGWTLNLDSGRTPDYVYVVSAEGEELSRSEPQDRPDVAQYVGAPSLPMSGFNLSIPARSLVEGDVSVRAAYGDTAPAIAILSADEGLIPGFPVVQIQQNSGERSDLTVWFDSSRDSFAAFSPDNRFQIPKSLFALIVLIDLVSLLVIFGLLVLLARQLRNDVLKATTLAAATFGVLAFGSRFNLNFLEADSLFLAFVSSALVISMMRFAPPRSLLAYLPTSIVLGAHTSFDHLERFHASQGARWWGRLLFYWRDSDWYATQGYARTVFLEGSLRGGEALFWFQAGPRYLAFVTRSLLGEQDALIGIIMTSLGFFAVFVLGVRFLEKSRDSFSRLVGGLSLFALLYFMSDDLMVSFGFLGSSEYPTWIVFLIAAAFVISARSEPRAWPMVVFAVALGYSIQLRPNQIGGIVLMFIVMLLLVDRADTVRAIGTMSKMVASFTAVVLFSLWHNLYYGESFTPFTANAGINYEFSWLDVLGLSAGDDSFGAVWDQLRFMMYWNAPGNLSWASLFWAAQLLWIVAIAYRYKKGLLFKAKSLLLLIPFGYALPMLKYQMTSYYPRHLVVINLAFLLTALMAWPHSEKADEVATTGDADLMPSATTGLETAVLSAPNR